MKTAPLLKIIPALILALTLTGCKGIESIEFTGIDNFQLKNFEENIITFSADIGVYNPAGIGFKVHEINLKVSADGVYMGSLTNNEAVKIAPRSDTVYNIPFQFRMTNILTGASSLYSLSKKKQVNVDVQGFVKSRSGLITKKVEVEETMNVEVPRLNFFN